MPQVAQQWVMNQSLIPHESRGEVMKDRAKSPLGYNKQARGFYLGLGLARAVAGGSTEDRFECVFVLVSVALFGAG
jgi:hypothetical protein